MTGGTTKFDSHRDAPMMRSGVGEEGQEEKYRYLTRKDGVGAPEEHALKLQVPKSTNLSTRNIRRYLPALSRWLPDNR